MTDKLSDEARFKLDELIDQYVVPGSPVPRCYCKNAA